MDMRFVMSTLMVFALSCTQPTDGGAGRIEPGTGEGPMTGQAAGSDAMALAQTAPASTGIVLETMDSGGYTYVKVETGGNEMWAAAMAFSVKVGDRVVIPAGAPMKDFYSKTLDRTFPLVYFVQSVTVLNKISQAGGDTQENIADSRPAPKHPSAAQTAVNLDYSDISRPEGGKTVAELYEQAKSLANQQVVLRGKVAKINPKIMGKNWVHLRDGTGAEGSDDLVITTQDTAIVGDTVLVQGKVVVDKDFGYGYKFDVLVEDATLTGE